MMNMQCTDVTVVIISDLCPQCTAFYGNRSACYLMLGQPRQALEDAKTATNLDPEFNKGWSRIARCCVVLQAHGNDLMLSDSTLAQVGSSIRAKL